MFRDIPGVDRSGCLAWQTLIPVDIHDRVLD